MSTTKETHTHEKEEKPKITPQWQRVDINKSFSRDRFDRIKDLVSEAVVILKQMQDGLDKTRK